MQNLTFAAARNDNVPTSIAVTFDKTTTTVANYFNGKFDSSSTAITGDPVYGATALVAFGDYTGPPSRNPNVLHDYGLIYNRLLTSSEIIPRYSRAVAPTLVSSASPSVIWRK